MSSISVLWIIRLFSVSGVTKLLNKLESYAYRIRWNVFISSVLCMPLFGLVFCVINSMIFYSKTSNATHCRPRITNYLPSISAAVGSSESSKLVWKTLIGLHTLPRYLVCFWIFRLYERIPLYRWKDDWSRTMRFCKILSLLEITALLSLSIYDSKSSYRIHEESFLIFLVCSVSYMIFYTKAQMSFTQVHQYTTEINWIYTRSLFYKKLAATICILSLFSAGYMFWRHNAYCEPGVYSVFALSEYIIVLANIAYHSTTALDYSAAQLQMQRKERHFNGA